MSDASTPQDLPPAYFLSLSLENVRCFGPEQTLDLSNEEGGPAQWTVLLGNNGTGKTTVLQAIAGMHTVESFQIESKLKVEPILKVGGGDFYSWWAASKRGDNIQSLQLKVGFFEGINSELAYTTNFSVDAGSSVFFPDEVDISCIGYGADRMMMSGAFEETDESGIGTLFGDEAELPNASEWLLQTDYAAKSGKPKAEHRLTQIERILADPDSGILPDVDALRFAEQKGDTAPPRVEFHTPYGWVTVDELSLGYRTMIAWVVDLARRLFERYPESDNPLAEPAVCLVDEIDLHLHPKWQRKIIDFLSERFPNTQFVVTAHSPLVVQAAQDANVAVLRRKENPGGDDYVVIDNDPARIRNWRIDQILTSDLFDLDSARPPQIEELWDERKRLLGQDELSDADEQRLAEIEKKIGDLPSGETKEQRDAMAFIKRVGDRLEREGPSS